jgi:hypothetical protein
LIGGGHAQYKWRRQCTVHRVRGEGGRAGGSNRLGELGGELRVKDTAMGFGGRCCVGDVRPGMHGHVQSLPPAVRRKSRCVARSRACRRARGVACTCMGEVVEVCSPNYWHF